MNKIIEKIIAERKKQDVKWGTQNHSPIEWIAILTEEVGEVSKEAVDYHFKNHSKESGFETTAEFETIQLDRLKNYKKELIQTAAVCMAMIESLERNELRNQLD